MWLDGPSESCLRSFPFGPPACPREDPPHLANWERCAVGVAFISPGVAWAGREPVRRARPGPRLQAAPLQRPGLGGARRSGSGTSPCWPLGDTLRLRTREAGSVLAAVRGQASPPTFPLYATCQSLSPGAASRVSGGSPGGSPGGGSGKTPSRVPWARRTCTRRCVPALSKSPPLGPRAGEATHGIRSSKARVTWLAGDSLVLFLGSFTSSVALPSSLCPRAIRPGASPRQGAVWPSERRGRGTSVPGGARGPSWGSQQRWLCTRIRRQSPAPPPAPHWPPRRPAARRAQVSARGEAAACVGVFAFPSEQVVRSGFKQQGVLGD